jgi:hypothetical protein
MAHARDHPVLQAEKQITAEAEEWKVTPSHSKRWKRSNKWTRPIWWLAFWLISIKRRYDGA